MVELGEGWREIIIPPPEEGKRVFLKPNFERLIKKPKWKIVHCGKKLYLRRIPENSSWEEIKNLPLLERVDVVVDGLFEEQFKDVNAPWVGSINQKVIDVQSSLLLGKIVLH